MNKVKTIKSIFSGLIDDLSLMMWVLVPLTILRGVLDLFQFGQLRWLKDLTMFVENVIGIAGFFLIIEIIQHFWGKSKRHSN